MYKTRKQYKTGVYCTSGSISDFQCRLTIRKIHSLIDVPILKGLCKKLDNEEAVENDSNENRIIRWQEKIFSRYEKGYYRIKENCKTEREKRYYQMLKTDTHKPVLLFTYVDDDNYYPNDADYQNRRRESNNATNKVESMHLMADLGSEVLLFSINWYPEERILTVYPDFNHIDNNPFCHEMRESNLHMYHYALEKCNVEKSIAPSRVKEIVLERWNAPLHSLPFDRKDRFIMPKQMNRNILILLEIVGATGFAYDEIHFRYHSEIPAGVKTSITNDALSGSTHTSKKYNNYWHFGHCHELLLVLPDSRNPQHQSMDMFFEAISIDGWNRERYLGHSHLAIPLHPHGNEATLSFVQFVHSGLLSDVLETFLVGNRRKVDLTAFYGKNGKNMLNRYGNETCSSGKLNVRYHIVRQHQPMVLNDGFLKSSRRGKNTTINELIASYSTARERLEEFIDLNY